MSLDGDLRAIKLIFEHWPVSSHEDEKPEHPEEETDLSKLTDVELSALIKLGELKIQQ